jgi:hypothetical protein
VQLFGDYLSEQNVADPRLNAMFAELLDELTGSAAALEESAVLAEPAKPAGSG